MKAGQLRGYFLVLKIKVKKDESKLHLYVTLTRPELVSALSLKLSTHMLLHC